MASQKAGADSKRQRRLTRLDAGQPGPQGSVLGGQRGDIMVEVPGADEADLVVRFGVSLGREGAGHRQLQDEEAGGELWE